MKSPNLVPQHTQHPRSKQDGKCQHISALYDVYTNTLASSKFTDVAPSAGVFQDVRHILASTLRSLSVFCLQAAELSIKFLSGERAVEVVQVVGPRLAQRRKYNDVREREKDAPADALS